MSSSGFELKYDQWKFTTEEFHGKTGRNELWTHAMAGIRTFLSPDDAVDLANVIAMSTEPITTNVFDLKRLLLMMLKLQDEKNLQESHNDQ